MNIFNILRIKCIGAYAPFLLQLNYNIIQTVEKLVTKVISKYLKIKHDKKYFKYDKST